MPNDMHDFSTAGPDIVFTGRWFICVLVVPQNTRRKTSCYEIVAKATGQTMAEIQWYGPWRKFALYPRPETVWEQTCLAEIAGLLHRMTYEYKQGTR